MKELVVISGKEVRARPVCLLLWRCWPQSVICDCDVEAPNLHILLQPEVQQTREFSASQQAHLDEEQCIFCGLCIDLCRFGAIQDFQVSNLDCEAADCVPVSVR